MNTTQLAGTGLLPSTIAHGNRLAGVLDRLGRMLRRTAPPARRAEVDVSLAPDRVHRIGRSLGCEISCQEGTLWLTLDNEPTDIVLEAGESHRCGVDSDLLVQALARPARFQVR